MSPSLASLLTLSSLISHTLAVPTVSLLIDNGYASTGTLSIHSILSAVSTKKGQAFHFGSTYDTYDANAGPCVLFWHTLTMGARAADTKSFYSLDDQ